MKNISTLIILLFVTINFAFAQIPPNAISYQAIVRNSNGNAYGNKDVNIRVSILEGSISGTVIYSEIHSLTTNKWGLIDMEIGFGSPVTGTFEAIDWSSNDFFCKTEIDLLNGQGYEVTGISQFLSVPYALYSGKSGTAETVETVDFSQITNVPVMFSGDYNDLTNIPTFADVAYSGDYNDLLNQPTIPTDLSELTDNTNIFQNISYNDLSDLPTLFSGNYNDLSNLPTLFSGDYNDLTNKPTIPTDLSDLTDNTNFFQNISYNDLTDLPTVPTDLSELTDNSNLLFVGNWSNLTNTPTTIAGYGITDAFSGNYLDLSNKPTIPTDISELTDNTNIFQNISYNDLTDLPTVPTDLSELTDNTSLLFDGNWSNLTNTPTTIAGYGITDAFSGSYNDLSNKLTAGTGITIDGSNVISSSITDTDDQTLNEILTSDNDAGGNNITNLADPVNRQDAVNKNYVTLRVSETGDTLFLGNEQFVIIQGISADNPNGSGIIVTDFDGNSYNAVTIGNQIWMAENLKVTHYPNGDPIPYISDNATWGNLLDDNSYDAYCFYNNNDMGGAGTYGALYTYAAAIGDNWMRDNVDNQGVCPDGWHLPTDTEWVELIDFLGGINFASGKMKEIGTIYWNSPNIGATNESGFTALPGGFRYYSNGVFDIDEGNSGMWWTATESIDNAWRIYLSYGTNYVYHDDNLNKSSGISVRCLKD